MRIIFKIFIVCTLMFNFAITTHAAQIKTLDKVDPEYRQSAYTYMGTYTKDEDLQNFQSNNSTVIPKEYQPEAVTVPEDGQNPAILLYIYRPKNNEVNENLPVIYYSHGGGFLFRSAFSDYKKYQDMANRLNAAVVTPRYRLSTEAPFPAALEDAYRGLVYIKNSADRLQLDADKIIVMGDSAGGGLSASLALYNRDHANIKLKGQILIYPMLDSRTGSESSLYHAPFTGEISWNAPTNKFAWEKLSGGKAISQDMFPYFSPAQATNLKNLPPVLIYVGDLDLFANEDLAYANKLIDAGVSTELHLIPGLYHVFDLTNPEGTQTKIFWATVDKTINKMFNE